MAFEKSEATKEKPKPQDEAPDKVKPDEGEQAKKATAGQRKDSKPRGAARKPGPKKLETKLTEMVQGVGGLMIGVGQVHDGVILYSRGEALAHAWAEAAEENKQIEKWLKWLTTSGTWSGVIIATGSVAIPIAQNHGIAKGVPTPFSINQKDVDNLPDELQMVVATYQQQAAEAQAKAQAVAGGGQPVGGNSGAPT